MFEYDFLIAVYCVFVLIFIMRCYYFYSLG